MKRIRILFLTALFLLTLPSCKKENLYRDDVESAMLFETAQTALKSEAEFLPAKDGYLNDYFTVPAYVTDYEIRFSKDGSALDEIGIFHVESGNDAAMATTLRDYLSASLSKNEAWYRSYIPEEIPKLRDSEVRTYGNYVAYAILSDADRAAFFRSLEDTLKL